MDEYCAQRMDSHIALVTSANLTKRAAGVTSKPAYWSAAATSPNASPATSRNCGTTDFYATLDGVRPLARAPSRLADVQTFYAMTMNRSQGSQFDRITLILPPADVPASKRSCLNSASQSGRI